DGDTRRIIAGRHASENSCGALHSTFEATENSIINLQGKRLRALHFTLQAASLLAASAHPSHLLL
ncbi:MAG: hypothetical protein E6009_12920, partial [Citrobacter freundii]|nr:hypothetical protein [Citrobacter freundii]MDU5714284.1 hypothetical protein [Citrobacter freundii]MDU5729371.1 hypothetical protein [Citrobacter freundii]